MNILDTKHKYMYDHSENKDQFVGGLDWKNPLTV